MPISFPKSDLPCAGFSEKEADLPENAGGLTLDLRAAGLMDARRLALLPEDAFLVNVGRGSTIDQKSLVALMRGGRLSGAALDVFAEEPLPPEDDVWDCPRLLVTPHVAGNMTLRYTLDRIVDMFLEDFENYCEGRPLLQEVDRERGY